HRHYGDVAYMRLGPYRDYTFFHPDAIKEILVTKARHFVRMPRLMKVLRQWNGEGLLIPEGDTWLRFRRLVQPAFNPKRLAAYAGAVARVAQERFDSWARQHGEFEVEFEQAMTEL